MHVFAGLAIFATATLCEILLDATGGLDKMSKHQEDIYESVKAIRDPINRTKFQQFCNVHRSTFYLLFGVCNLKRLSCDD